MKKFVWIKDYLIQTVFITFAIVFTVMVRFREGRQVNDCWNGQDWSG